MQSKSAQVFMSKIWGMIMKGKFAVPVSFSELSPPGRGGVSIIAKRKNVCNRTSKSSTTDKFVWQEPDPPLENSTVDLPLEHRYFTTLLAYSHDMNYW